MQYQSSPSDRFFCQVGVLDDLQITVYNLENNFLLEVIIDQDG